MFTVGVISVRCPGVAGDTRTIGRLAAGYPYFQRMTTGPTHAGCLMENRLPVTYWCAIR